MTDGTRYRPHVLLSPNRRVGGFAFFSKELSDVVHLDILEEFFTKILKIIHEKLYHQYEGPLLSHCTSGLTESKVYVEKDWQR